MLNRSPYQHASDWGLLNYWNSHHRGARRNLTTLCHQITFSSVEHALTNHVHPTLLIEEVTLCFHVQDAAGLAPPLVAWTCVPFYGYAAEHCILLATCHPGAHCPWGLQYLHSLLGYPQLPLVGGYIGWSLMMADHLPLELHHNGLGHYTLYPPTQH